MKASTATAEELARLHNDGGVQMTTGRRLSTVLAGGWLAHNQSAIAAARRAWRRRLAARTALAFAFAGSVLVFGDFYGWW